MSIEGEYDIKRIISAILLLLMLISAASCAQSEAKPTDNGDNTSAAVTEGETEPPDVLAAIPEADFESSEFRMLARNFERWYSDMYVETETGDVVDDAVYKRNLAVIERYNVQFSLTKSSSDNYETDAIKSITAGDDAYELVIPHPRAAFVYANQLLFLDWNKDIPVIDLDNKWWDQDARENLSINHKLLIMVGDISYQSMGACNVMLFNKKLFDDNGIQYPYQNVADNSWTFDKFEEIVRTGSKDLNGDSKIDKDNDQFGYVTQYWIGPIQALYVAGQRVLSKDENDIPYLSLNNETTISTFEWYYGIIDDDCAYIQTDGNSWASGFLTMFSEGRSLLIDMNMEDVITMRTMDADFGIVPWPKLNETSEYCTNVDAGTNMFGVPITSTKLDMVGTVLEALCALGYESVVPAYYDIALSTKFTRDEDSADMLDIIKQSRVFDLGYYNDTIVNFTLANQFAAFAATKDRDFASWYAKNEKAAIKSLEKYIAIYS